MLLFYPDLVDMDKVDDPLYEACPPSCRTTTCCPSSPTTPRRRDACPGRRPRRRAIRASFCATWPSATWWTPSAPSSPEGIGSKACDRIWPSRGTSPGGPVSYEEESDRHGQHERPRFQRPRRERADALARPTRRSAFSGTTTRSNRGIVMSTSSTARAKAKVPFKVALSSFLGNFIEWFRLRNLHLFRHHQSASCSFPNRRSTPRCSPSRCSRCPSCSARWERRFGEAWATRRAASGRCPYPSS